MILFANCNSCSNDDNDRIVCIIIYLYYCVEIWDQWFPLCFWLTTGLSLECIDHQILSIFVKNIPHLLKVLTLFTAVPPLSIDKLNLKIGSSFWDKYKTKWQCNHQTIVSHTILCVLLSQMEWPLHNNTGVDAYTIENAQTSRREVVHEQTLGPKGRHAAFNTYMCARRSRSHSHTHAKHSISGIQPLFCESNTNVFECMSLSVFCARMSACVGFARTTWMCLCLLTGD